MADPYGGKRVPRTVLRDGAGKVVYFVLPALIAAVIGLHLYLVVRLGVSGPAEEGE